MRGDNRDKEFVCGLELSFTFTLPTNNDYEGVRYQFSIFVSYIVCVCEVL